MRLMPRNASVPGLTVETLLVVRPEVEMGPAVVTRFRQQGLPVLQLRPLLQWF